MTEVVEHLPSKHKTLISNHNTTKKNEYFILVSLKEKQKTTVFLYEVKVTYKLSYQ
jgi:hypothetical protein